METENQKIEVNFLAHHGVTGQKWGERRYQNKDGSLTPLGRIHWGIGQARTAVSNKLKTRKSFRLETDSEKRKRLKLKAEKKEENKKLKLQKAEEAKQKKAEAIERKKAKLIAKGDKDAIYKNRDLFSDEELDKAMARINKVNQFKTEKVSKAKEHLINRANPREIYANRSQLNDEELDRALKRVDKLKTVNPAEKKALEKLQQTKDNRQTAAKGKITLDKIASTGKTLVGIAGVAVSAYEAYNQIAANVNEIAGYEKWKVFKIRPWDDLMPKKGKSTEDKILEVLEKQNKNKGDDSDSDDKTSKGDASSDKKQKGSPNTDSKDKNSKGDTSSDKKQKGSPNANKLSVSFYNSYDGDSGTGDSSYNMSSTDFGQTYNTSSKRSKSSNLDIITNTVWDLPRSVKDVYNGGTMKDFQERVAKRDDRSYKLGKKLQDDYEKRLANKLRKTTGDGDLSNYMSSPQVERDQNQHNRTAEGVANALYKGGSMINGMIAVGKSLGKWPSDSVNVSTVDAGDFYIDKLVD